MRHIKLDEKGVSPVIATVLMLGITVTLASTVFLISGEYIEIAGGGPEIFIVDIELDPDGIREAGSEGRGEGHTYSAVVITSTHRMIDWSDYKVTVDESKVFTVPSKVISRNQVPDASDDPSPVNKGKTPVGLSQYFTEEGFRNDYQPLMKGEKYDVVIVNIDDTSVVWSGEVIAI
jgi:flagellin-like protein